MKTVTQHNIPEERNHLIHHPETSNVMYRLVLLNIYRTKNYFKQQWIANK